MGTASLTPRRSQGRLSIELHKEMLTTALRAISLSSLGDTFTDLEEVPQLWQADWRPTTSQGPTSPTPQPAPLTVLQVRALQEAYHTCWHEMERRVGGDMPEPDRYECINRRGLC